MVNSVLEAKDDYTIDPNIIAGNDTAISKDKRKLRKCNCYVKATTQPSTHILRLKNSFLTTF